MTRDSAVFLGAGVGYDVTLGRRWVVTPTFAPGYYRKGNGKDLGYPLEFRSQLELGYQFGSGYRFSIAISHVSNAGLGQGNPGQESLTLVWELPLARRRVH
jgi:lipid A 3-O-deacylase